MVRAEHTVVTLRGLHGGSGVFGDATPGIEKLGVSVGIAGVDARVDIGPDSILIGSADPKIGDGLSIDLISVSSLDFTGRTEKGKRFSFNTTLGGSVDLFAIRARIRVDKWKTGEKHTSTAPFKQVTIEHLLIEKINVGGFAVGLPDDDVCFEVPQRAGDAPATVNRVEIGGAADGAAPLVIDMTSMTAGPKPKLALTYRGGVDIAGLNLPFKAKVKNIVNDVLTGGGKLTTDRIKLGFAAAGGIKIDVDNPELTKEGIIRLGDGRIRVGKIGAAHLKYDEGVVTATGSYVEGLSYEKIAGPYRVVSVIVPRATLPKEAKYNTATGGVDIDSLAIENAYFSVDLASLLGGGSSQGGGSSKPADVALKPVLASVNGTVKVVLFVRADVAGFLTDIRVGQEGTPLEVPIAGGSVDIPKLEKNAANMVAAIDEPGLDLPQSWIGFFGRDPMLRLDNSKRTLELGIYLVDPARAGSGNDKKPPTRRTVVTRGGPITVTDEKRPDDVDWISILSWDLTNDFDLEEARKDRFHLWTAIFRMSKGKGPTEESRALMNSLEIRSLDADLSMQNTQPIPIPITSDSVNGSITLGDHALMNLTIKGGIPPVVSPEGRPGTNPGGLNIGLDAIKLAGVDLKISDHQLKTGSITIGKMKDARIVFGDLFRPLRISGRINAQAENIHWSKLGTK